MQKIVSTGYVPRTLQARLHILIHMIRFVVLVCHRRFGKTVFTINEMIDRSLHCKNKNPQYAYLCPTYGQAKRVAWQYLKDYTQHLPGFTANEAELRVTITAPHGNGKITYVLLGAENADAIRGMYFDGVILDEYGDMHPEVWSMVLRPALSDRKGWAIFIGTPKGHNDFKDKYDHAVGNPNWFAATFKASQTGLIDKEELEAAKTEMGDEAYEQEYECSWSSTNTGAYYAKYINDLRNAQPARIRTVPYDPALLVDTFWDLGIGDSTAIWFRQQIGNEYRYIDYYEASGQGLDHYVKICREKPYAYGRHVFPHDASVRDLSSGRTRIELLRSLGIRGEIQAKQKVDDRIQAVRSILPKCFFDSLKCEKGLNALENYQRKWDAKNKLFSDSPLHNWASHAADAFGYSALDSRDTNAIRNKELPKFADSSYNEFEY